MNISSNVSFQMQIPTLLGDSPTGLLGGSDEQEPMGPKAFLQSVKTSVAEGLTPPPMN